MCRLVVEGRTKTAGLNAAILFETAPPILWTAGESERGRKKKKISQTESKTNVQNLRFIIVAIVKDELSLKKPRLRVQWSNRKI